MYALGSVGSLGPAQRKSPAVPEAEANFAPVPRLGCISGQR